MKVALVQISMGIWSSQAGSGGTPQSFGLLPYSVGTLQAHAERYARRRHDFVMPIHRRMPVAEAVERLRGQDLVGFSIYVWNVRLSLAIAAGLRRVEPGVVIVMGGPQVPDRAADFLRGHPYIDVVAHGEGEETFTELLDAAPRRAWHEVRSVSYLDANGEPVSTPRRDRVRDLDALPSPYLTGAFEQIMAQNPAEGWVMTWETNRGCPFSCTFCDWGSATASKVYQFGMGRLREEIAWMSRHRIGFVFCCDANFGILPRDLDLVREVVAAKERTGFPFSLSVQNTKNAQERAYQVQTLIAESFNALGVTISLQSATPETLANIKRRNISSAAFEDLQRRFAADGVYTYTDLILGLPGETYDQFADGISHVVATGQHNHIQFHNCSVLPNAEMGDPEYRRRFGLRTVSQMMTNMHEPVDRIEEVPEYLDIVVATDAMPAHDWRRARAFAWLTDFAYFDRVLQVPMAVLGRSHAVPLRAFIEALLDADRERFPVLGGLLDRMTAHAASIAAGGNEHCHRADAAGLWWPADQFALITLVLDGLLGAFYREAEQVLTDLLAGRGIAESPLLIGALFDFNEAVLRVPAPAKDRLLLLPYPVDAAYRAALVGAEPALGEEWSMYAVDRSTRPVEGEAAWFEHLVWCHGKDKRGYLAPVAPARPSRLRRGRKPADRAAPSGPHAG